MELVMCCFQKVNDNDIVSIGWVGGAHVIDLHMVRKENKKIGGSFMAHLKTGGCMI